MRGIQKLVGIYQKETGCGFDTVFVRSSLERFVEELGLKVVERNLYFSLDKMRKRSYPTFKYFCKVCWNQIREMEKKRIEICNSAEYIESHGGF